MEVEFPVYVWKQGEPCTLYELSQGLKELQQTLDNTMYTTQVQSDNLSEEDRQVVQKVSKDVSEFLQRHPKMNSCMWSNGVYQKVVYELHHCDDAWTPIEGGKSTIDHTGSQSECVMM